MPCQLPKMKLIDQVFDIWQNLEFLLIDKLLNSIPNRFNEVVTCEGCPINY